MRYMPPKMIEYEVPRDGNCLFSSMTVHLNGNAENGMLLKLHFCLRAIKDLNKIVDKVCFSKKYCFSYEQVDYLGL